MLQFSTDTPCVANVIPAMDRMHANLEAALKNENYSPAIRAALKIGLNSLQILLYYSYPPANVTSKCKYCFENLFTTV